MAKESVIVFDGEDKFIAKKGTQYDKFSGFGNSVGAGGEIATTPEGAAFNQYIASQNTSLVIPSVSDTDFCVKAQQFISTNGDGRATPEQIMQVYNDFQATCVRPSEDVEPFVEPDWATLSCDEIDEKLRSLNETMTVSRLVETVRVKYENAIANGNRIKAEKCGINPPALPDVPPTPPPTNVTLTNLGVPPAKPKAPSGGGQKEEKKGTNFLIWVLVAAAAYMLLSSDKK